MFFCLIQLLVGNATNKFQEYDRALAYLTRLLQHESNNRQAAKPCAVIKERMRNDGLWGAAIWAAAPPSSLDSSCWRRVLLADELALLPDSLPC